MHRTLAISAVNRLAELPRVAEAVGAFLANACVPRETIETTHLVVDELFSNIVCWAHEDGAEHAVQVRIALETDGVRLTVEDDGRAFDPLSVPAPDFHVPPAGRSEGGLGIHLVRALTERLTYERVGGRNVVQATIADVARDPSADT